MYLSAIVFFLFAFLVFLSPSPAHAVDYDCRTTNNTVSTGASYSAQICLDAPTAGSKSGEITVTGSIASFTETHPSGGATPTIGRLEFFLAPSGTADPSSDNGTDLKTNAIYLNGSFRQGATTSYSFTLDTAQYKDVTDWELWVAATVRVSGTTGMKGDYYWTDPAKHTVTLNNGNTNTPVNTNTFTPTTPNPSGDMIVAVTGDGGASDGNGLDVGNLMASWTPHLALFLGDVYWSGSHEEYRNWYHPQLGAPGSLKAITNPVIGNHEYQATGPIGSSGEGYYWYWNNAPQYYSYDAKGWHFISLNTNTSTIKTVTGGGASVSYDNSGPSGVGRLTDTSKNWRTNQFVNQTVTIGSQRIYIASNTSTQLVLKNAWSSVPSSGTNYTINGGVEMQTKWLEDDLAANQNKCIVALGHHPRFTIGDHFDEATDAKLGWAWNRLVDNKATAFLVGHDHSYQRWDPIGVAGDETKYATESAGGVTQFVIGTGGHGGTELALTDDRVAEAWAGTPTNTNAGAMKMAFSTNTINFNMYKLSSLSTPSDSGSISCKGQGSITGRVTNAASGAGISGVNVAYNGAYADEVAPSNVTGSVTTDGDGYYTISNKAALNYTLTLTKSGFDNKVLTNVAISGAATTTQNTTMDANVGSVSGTITDAGTGATISGATVTIAGIDPVTTDGSGNYTFSEVLNGTYKITASKSGYASKDASITVTINNSVTQNFALPQSIFTDNFETGDLSKWTTNNNLTAQQTTVNTGDWAAEGNTTSAATNLRKTLGSSYSTLFYRTYFNVKSQGSGSGLGLLAFRTASDAGIIKTYIDGTTNKLCIRNEVTLTNTCSNTMPTQNAWHSVEMQTIINGTSSTHKVWYDGAEVTALTSTTADLASNNIGRIVLGEVNSGRTFDVVFDDVALYNAYVGGIVGTVSGTVTDSLSSDVVGGAALSYSGGSATSRSDGTYTFVNVPLGAHTFTASKTGYTTQTPSVNVNTEGTVTKNYSLVPTTGRMTGTVTDAKTGNPISGVTLTYSGGTTTSNGSGQYTLLTVTPGTYIVTASKTGYVSRDASITVTAGNITTQNFVISQDIFSDNFESGNMTKWTTNNNLAVQQTTTHFGSNAAEGNTTSLAMNARKTLSTTYSELYYRTYFNVKSQNAGSSIGLVSFRNSSDGGIIKVYVDGGTDRKLCIRNEITATNTCSTTIPTQNAWHSIELRTIIDGTSSTHEVWYDGTAVTALNSTSANLGTSNIGRIHLGETNANRTYDIVFDDVLVQETQVGLAGGSIAGKVTDSQSSGNLSGASVSITGNATTTDSNGDYVLSDIAPGVYTLTVDKSGYTQQQPSVTVIANNSTTKNVALVGNNIGTVSGTVTDAGTSAPVSGVTISYSGGNTTTDGSGNYTLNGVVAGTYTFTASKTGYTTKTASVIVTASQTTTQNFALPLLIFSDNFETGDFTKWTTNNNLTAQQTTVNSGSYAAEGNTTTLAMNLRKTLGSTHANVYYRTYFNIKSQGTSSGIGLLQPRTDTDGVIMKVYIETDGRLCVRNEVAAANTCSTITPTQNAWHSVELHVVINGTSSTHEVWYDGSTVTALNSTSANLGSTNIGRLNLGEVNSGRTYDIVFDDVVVQNVAVGQ